MNLEDTPRGLQVLYHPGRGPGLSNAKKKAIADAQALKDEEAEAALAEEKEEAPPVESEVREEARKLARNVRKENGKK
jgi:hypothetical protein